MTRTHDEAVRLASDPATPLKVLHELAMNHPEVHPLLAENPSTYPDLLTWLSGRGNPAINAALARRAVTSAEGAATAADAGGPAQDQTAAMSPAGAEPEPHSSSSGEDLEGPSRNTPSLEEPEPVAVDVDSDVIETATAAAAAANVPIEDLPTSAMAAIQDESDDAQPVQAAQPSSSSTGPEAPSDVLSDRSEAKYGRGAPAISEPTAVVQEAPTVAAPIQQAPGAAPARQSILKNGNEWNYGPRATQRLPQQPVQQPAPQFAPQQSSAPAVQPAFTPPPEEPEEPRRGAGFWALLALLALLLLAGIIWAINAFGGEGDTEPTDSPTTEQTDAASDPADATDPASEPTEDAPAGSDTEALSSALTAALAESTCTASAEDAALFDDWAAAIESAEAGWDETHTEQATSKLQTLQDRCNPGYALSVKNAQSSLAALDLGDWLTPIKAAPSGATQLTGFSSPTGNIRCSLGETSAYCTILNYNFSLPEQATAEGSCAAGRPATLLVDGDDARFQCEGEAAGGQALPYNTSAVNGQMACTSTDSGVECWNTLTGSGFKVARATGDLTAQQWGSGRN